MTKLIKSRVEDVKRALERMTDSANVHTVNSLLCGLGFAYDSYMMYGRERELRMMLKGCDNYIIQEARMRGREE